MPDINVKAADWSAISKDEQDKILRILQNAELLKPGDKIVSDARLTTTAAFVAPSRVAPAGIFCKIACDLGEAAAVAACSLLSGPAVPICVAAAHAAGELCRSKC